MSGYWERVIARFTDGGLSFGFVPRFMGHNLGPATGKAFGRLFDNSLLTSGSTHTDVALLAKDNNLCHLVPIIVPVTSVFDNIGVNVNVAASPGRTALAIYRDRFLSDYTGFETEVLELVRPLGILAADTIGLQFTDPASGIGDFVLEQGFYWMAVQTQLERDVFVKGYRADALLALTGYESDTATPTPFLIGTTTGVVLGEWPELLTVTPYIPASYPSMSSDTPRVFLSFKSLLVGNP